MKRILLSLAAVAVLASCVKENNLASLAGQETISAVSSDSKTLLDGNNVVWETTDKIAVVVNGETQVTAEFAVVEETVNGSEADFVGNTGADWSKATFAYAVYPAASVNLTHNLPAEQNGDVSGLMLSTAVVPVDDMKNGSASVEFNPALSLLNVIVPAGVKSVELTSAGSALVGEALYEIESDYKAVISGFNKEVKTVTLTVAEAGTYPVIVYPGTVGDFTIKLVGTNDETFEKTVPDITLVAAEARAVNLMQIFEFAPEAMEVAANGGTIELPFTTTVEEITVTEDADWLKSAVAVKGFQTGNVTLVATANEGEEARTAVVTVSWGEGKSVSFTLTQPAIYRGFLNDENGDPIQWEETFKVYASESDANDEANAKATYKNVFTIALNDEDYTKGTYKISNMFKTDAYFGEGYQMITNKGGEYYADYADGKLTVKMADAKKSYFFTKDVVLTYDETAQKFTSNGVLSFDMNSASSYNKAGVVAGYAAVVKVEEPEEPEVPGGNNELDKFVGTWSETYVNKPYSWSAETIYENEFTVSVVDGKLYFEGMFLFKMSSTEYRSNYYGTPSADGTTVTLEDADLNSPHGNFGPLAYSGGPIVLSVDGNKLTVASAYNGQVANYVATKQGAVEPEPEVPADPWASDAVVSYVLEDWMYTSYPAYSDIKEIKAVADADYVYVRLTPTKVSTEIRFYFANEGENMSGDLWMWENTAYGTFYKSSRATVTDNNFNLVYGTEAVTLNTEVEGESVVWNLAIPRNGGEYTKNAGFVYLGFMTYGEGYEAPIPKVWGEMLKVTLP